MVQRLFAMTVAPLLVLTLARTASAQRSHPDFTGRWVLDTARSEQNPLTPTTLEVTVERTGDTLQVTSHAVRQTVEATTKTILDLAGRPTRNVISQGGTEFEFTTTTAWVGDSLKVTTVGTPQGQAMTQRAVWSLSADGKTLGYSLSVDVGVQHLAARLALSRAPGPVK